MHVQNARRVLAASSSFCMHRSWVSGMSGTLQECLGKKYESHPGSWRLGLFADDLIDPFSNPGFA